MTQSMVSRLLCKSAHWIDDVSAVVVVTAVSAIAAALLALSGCATPEPTTPPVLPTAAEVGLHAAQATPEAPNEWWWMFNDPQLDSLIQQALVDQPSGQPNGQVVQARLARAQAMTASTRAGQSPQIGLAADATWQRYSARGLLPPQIAGSTHDSGNLQLNGSYALDLFGKQAAALKASVGAERAAQADVAAAKAMISAQVAQAYVGLARLRSMAELAARTVAQREAVLALTQQRVQAGIDNQGDVASVQTALAESRTQSEALNEQAAVARHALAVLCGLAPQAVDELAPSLPPLQPAALPQRLGADLLGRRADVLAARWRVEAAAGQLDQAVADYAPDINLVGFIGLNSLGLDKLLSLPSRTYGVGPALRLPIFDGGRLKAQQRGRQAELDVAVASYRGVVLDAARQALDALSSLQSLQVQMRTQASAVGAADRGVQIARERRRAGVGNELQALAAETAWLAQRRSLTDLHARVLDSQVALIQALGGGWTLPDELKTLTPLAAVALTSEIGAKRP